MLIPCAGPAELGGGGAAPRAKMSPLRLLAGCCWLLATLADGYQVNRNSNGAEDGSKLIRLVGDVIFGGIFPMHEQVGVSGPGSRVFKESRI